MSNIIIGAGPAGLYAAIKLHQAGLRNITIYDPRAGTYTRPGHLNTDAYLKVKSAVPHALFSSSRTYHIKDLERELYKEAQRLGICIKKDVFVRLHQDPRSPGVVVFNQKKNKDDIIPADYVFDATGTKRAVVTSVNKLDSASPLTLSPITALPIYHHFLAYVTMSNADFKLLEEGYSNPDTTDAAHFSDSILALRDLGWHELKFPRCYGASFGKNKVCLYLHAPAHLSEENYDLWVNTVLHCYARTVSYQHVKPSKKYTSKPRFGAFQMDANVLGNVSYRGNNLPYVIALGDAQIDFDYVRAHGVLHGLQRIDTLLKCMEMLNGHIAFFDSSEYESALMQEVNQHKKQVIHAAENLKQNFLDAIPTAQRQLEHTHKLNHDTDKKHALAQVLQEIEVRLCYLAAKQKMNASPSFKFNEHIMDTLHDNLLKSHTNLPDVFSSEKQDILRLLKELARAWKNLGNNAFQDKCPTQAINSYQKALEIYTLPVFDSAHLYDVLVLYSNIMITHLTHRPLPHN
jgi:hypothetical protein